MHTVADNELMFGADLHIVARLKLAVSHVIFFHSHEGRVMVCLTVAVSRA